MELWQLMLVVFLLVFYAFAFGCECGRRIRISELTPFNRFKPRFRLIYKNPKTHDLRRSR